MYTKKVEGTGIYTRMDGMVCAGLRWDAMMVLCSNGCGMSGEYQVVLN